MLYISHQTERPYMLTMLDSELYPDDCEVVELSQHGLNVYLIQKNGTTSLRYDIDEQNLKVYKNDEISNLDVVDVYIRNPFERYVSGVNTYLQQLKNDHHILDVETCFWFATNYNFLNRHYLPQFLWLINLSRFISPDCQINLRKFSDFGKITNNKSRAGIDPASDKFKKMLTESLRPDVQLWFGIDQMLEDKCGGSYKFQDIIQETQIDPSAFNVLGKQFIEVAKNILPHLKS